jgi:hypothetical protein
MKAEIVYKIALRVPGRVDKEKVDSVALGRCHQRSGTCAIQHEAAPNERAVCHDRMTTRSIAKGL